MTQKTLDSLGESSSDDSANGGEAPDGQHAEPSAVESGDSSPSLSAEHITTHAPDDVEDWVEERKQAGEEQATLLPNSLPISTTRVSDR